MGKSYNIVIYSACVFLCCLLPTYTSAQTVVKDYVSQNTNQVMSISLNDTSWSDLESLGQAIGSSRVVMLGEQDHGDAATMAAKSRIIRYLHEKKGFNVLAMEASFWGLNSVYEGAIADSVYRNQLRAIYPFWTYCDAANSLFYNYIPSTLNSQNPLRLAGIDVKPSSYKHSWLECENALSAANIPFLKSAVYTNEWLPAWEDWLNRIRDTLQTRKMIGMLTELKGQVVDSLGKNNFWAYYLDNQVSTLKDFSTDLSYWDKSNQRDEQMAANLRWLLDEKFKNEKIIVWAANVHISKYTGHYPNKVFNPMKSISTFLFQNSDWESNTYILGFTAHHGYGGRLFPPTILKIPDLEKNSYENWVNPSYDYCFTDFKKYNLIADTEEMFFLSGGIRTTKVHGSDKALWNKVFDGIFFIREMYRCQELKVD